MIKKYMHENLRHTVIKHLAKKKKKNYSHFNSITTNNSKHVLDFISNNADTFMELFPNNTNTFPDIKQYWYFQRFTGKQYYSVYIKQY